MSPKYYNKISLKIKLFLVSDNGVIDFNEFLIFMRQYNTDQHERQDPEILEAFQVYDKNRDGYICPNEIIVSNYI